MNRTGPYWMSFSSGFIWALLGLALAVILRSGPGSTYPIRQSAFQFMGGMLAAPLIGLLMGHVSRIFDHVDTGMRIIIAGASLYAAEVLFVMASFLLSSAISGHMPRDFWTNSFGAATLGFEFSCVLLWPAAYANHKLIARAWARQPGPLD